MVFSSPTLHVIAAVKYNYCLPVFLTLGAVMRAMPWYRVRKWREFLKLFEGFAYKLTYIENYKKL